MGYQLLIPGFFAAAQANKKKAFLGPEGKELRGESQKADTAR
jgi:hypothetical protein